MTLALWLLGIIAVCAVVHTATLVLTARDARQTLQRVRGLLPPCRQTLRQVRLVLERAQHAADQVDDAVGAVAGAAQGTVRQLTAVQHRVEQWLHPITNGHRTGAGSGARSARHRSRGEG